MKKFFTELFTGPIDPEDAVEDLLKVAHNLVKEKKLREAEEKYRQILAIYKQTKNNYGISSTLKYLQAICLGKEPILEELIENEINSGNFEQASKWSYELALLTHNMVCLNNVLEWSKSNTLVRKALFEKGMLLYINNQHIEAISVFMDYADRGSIQSLKDQEVVIPALIALGCDDTVRANQILEYIPSGRIEHSRLQRIIESYEEQDLDLFVETVQNFHNLSDFQVRLLLKIRRQIENVDSLT